MAIDPAAFRAVLGRFASGVTVVTARDERGEDHGMTVSAFCSLSLEPPLVLFCLDEKASMHPLLDAGMAVTINILAAGQEALSRRFSGKDSNRFDGIGYTRGQRGAPMLDDVLAALECVVTERRDGGDHTIFIAQVEHCALHAGAPLLYYRGGYAQLEH